MGIKELLEGLEITENTTQSEIISHINKKLKESKSKILIDSKDEPNYIPKFRLDNEISKRKSAESTVNELQNKLDEKIEDIKNAEKYKLTAEQLKAKLDNYEKLDIIKSSIKQCKHQPHDLKEIVDKYLDMEKVTIKDGKAEGVEEQIEELAKSKSYLFKKPEGGTNGPGLPLNDDGLGNEMSIGDKLAKSTFNKHDDITKAQNDFFS